MQKSAALVQKGDILTFPKGRATVVSAEPHPDTDSVKLIWAVEFHTSTLVGGQRVPKVTTETFGPFSFRRNEQLEVVS